MREKKLALIKLLPRRQCGVTGMATKKSSHTSILNYPRSHVGGGGEQQIGMRTRTALSAGSESNLIHLNMVG